MSRTSRGTLAVLLACAMGLSGPVSAALNGVLTVRWDPNTTDADLASYRVFISSDASVFALTPAQAAPLATTRVVSKTATETIFNTLDPAKVYWVAVTSIDTSGNESVFSTVVSAQPRDTTAPAVSLTAPAAGSTLSGARTVSANATDDVGVAGVQFKLDGANLGAEDTTAPYSISWDTTLTPNGSHSLTATARDAAGNTTTSTSVAVTVTNVDTTPPVVALTAPAAGANLTGTLTVSASASDNVGVVGVRFKLDGANLGAEDTTTPYSIAWDTNTTTDGPHTLSAVARDAAGNTTTSAPVSVTVANADVTPPTVSVTAPSAGAVLAFTVTVTATASDNVGVVGVLFQVDGVSIGPEDTAAPWSISWDTLPIANGTHTITATARDAAGNTKVSAPLSVTVNNDRTPPSPPPNVRVIP